MADSASQIQPMRPLLIGCGLVLTVHLVPAIAADRGGRPQAGTETMAQGGAGQQAIAGRDVLVLGAGAVIDGHSRTRIKIDLGAQAVPAQPKLELQLSPSEVVSNEPYLVMLEGGEGTGAKNLGAVSFYPPKVGVAQAFYFDAAPLVADMKARGTTSTELILSLVPVDKTRGLTSSKVRLLGARLVGP